MPRSIIDIDINDEKFKDFLALFGKFEDQLTKMPAAWTAGATAAATVTRESATITAALLFQTEVMREQRAEQDKAARAASAQQREKADAAKEVAREETAQEKERTEAAKEAAKVEAQRQKAEEEHQEKVRQFWRDSATLTGGVVRNVASITKHIVEFAAKSIGLGLIGAGAGLFGLDALANGVSGRRVAAQGLGISTGEMQAFQLNFGNRLGLGSDLIGHVQDVQSDVSQSWQFGQLGISPDEVGSSDHAQLSADVIKRAKVLWDESGPTGHNQQWMGAHGLSGFMDFRQWQTIGAQSSQDIDSYADQYVKDSKALSVSDPDQKDWQSLSIQLKRAGSEIENVFIKGLAPLAGPLGDLSAKIADAIRIFLGNPQLRVWMTEFGDAIERLARYMGTDDFQKDVVKFSNSLVVLADAVGRIAGFLVDIAATGKPVPGHPGLTQTPLGPVGNSTPQGETIWQHLFGNIGHMPWSMPKPEIVGNDGKPISGGVLPPNMPADISTLEQKFGLPDGLLTAIGTNESHMNPHPADTYDGGEWHRGMYQMSDTMLKKYGITDPYDAGKVSAAAAEEEAGYLKRFHGNVPAAIAAWNQGAGGTQAAIDKGGEGDGFLTAETPAVQHYIEKAVLTLLQHQKTSHIKVTANVNNQTGAQVAMTANAVHQ